MQLLQPVYAFTLSGAVNFIVGLVLCMMMTESRV
jgi:hypothetical protein